MNWYYRLSRFTLLLMGLAAGYGLFAGAYVAMYYQVTPNMSGREDRLGSPLLLLYLAIVILSLPHLFLSLWDGRHRLWAQGATRFLAFAGPVFVVMASEGLVSHFLYWQPISHTDQFHLLHHTITAGLPLTILYGLALRRWWPAGFVPQTPPVSKWFLVPAIVITLFLVLALGIMIGLLPLPGF
ncbi:MAG: hypothetical protein L0332_24565 [Chloroflexi bacterium]|nr:hypothetical protein [Chloroflexota bacterium]MCI0579879.1 hypothetical protein [Chloroflexota bacterium]MCI0646160.1 hypothetical protein [Chloroflexota bacterium]MCI0729870.1 hypothetical protein [Chloroflexota bacterium]